MSEFVGNTIEMVRWLDRQRAFSVTKSVGHPEVLVVVHRYDPAGVFLGTYQGAGRDMLYAVQACIRAIEAPVGTTERGS